MTANGLRVALLIIGVIILAGIYFYSRWRSQKQVNDIFAASSQDRPDILLGGQDIKQPVEPTLPELGQLESEVDTDEEHQADTEENEILVEAKEPIIKQEPLLTEKLETKPEKPPETIATPPKRLKLVVMHLVAKQGKKLKGEAVLKALQAHKLRFGEMEIFHRITKIDDKDMSIFSVANMVKPGTLIPDKMDKVQLPGISFFLKLPAPIDSLKAYDDMLHCVQHMATTLDADIKDEEFMTLSREKIALQRAQLF